MLEFYPQIRAVHMGAALASGGLFALRGLLLLGGHARLARATGLRLLSWSIDSVLLTAALMLVTLLPRALFGNGWLTMKLVLLPLYIALGHLALRQVPGQRGRALCWVLALLIFLQMLGIARQHHPWGWLSVLID